MSQFPNATSVMIVLEGATLAFPDLFNVGKPVPGSVSAPKYGGSFIMAPDSEAFKLAQAAFLHVATVKFGKNASAIVAELAKDKKCLRRGDSNLDKAGEIRDGFAGQFYIVARNAIKPAVVGRNKEPLSESDGVIYGGCVVNAAIEIYAMDGGTGKSVNAKLLAVQFVADGRSFGGGQRPNADMFASFGDLGGAAQPTSGADLF